MLLKQLFSITLALVSFSTMAETTETPTPADKKTDTTQSVEKSADAPASTEKKSEDTSSTTEKAADTSASPKEKGETINIKVIIHAKDVAGVGYSVDGTDSGEAGNSHAGVGPSNKTYSFGYRKHPKIHENIPCGTAQLTKDTTVTLIAVGERCHLKVE